MPNSRDPATPLSARAPCEIRRAAVPADVPDVAQWALLLDPARMALLQVSIEADQCQLLAASTAAPHLFGYPLEALRAARDLCARLDTDERIRLLNSVRKAAAENSPCVEQLRYEHPETGLRQLTIRAVQVSPGASAWHALVEDITEQDRADHNARHLNAALERRVAERTNALQAKTRQLEAFTYSVSHDLKAPLRGIDGYSRLLQEHCASHLTDEGRLFVRHIRDAAQQMVQLIEDLLSYSRLERAELRLGPVALPPLVQSVLDERHPTAGDHVCIDIELRCQHVWGEAQAIKLALRNLMDNALKFSAHQPQQRITIGSALHQGQCRLWVQDNGPGFDMLYQDRIFEIFQRLHRQEEVPGTGVGLAIVRKAMERIGGRAWAESRLGEGACFYLEMPVTGVAVSQPC